MPCLQSLAAAEERAAAGEQQASGQAQELQGAVARLRAEAKAGEEAAAALEARLRERRTAPAALQLTGAAWKPGCRSRQRWGSSLIDPLYNKPCVTNDITFLRILESTTVSWCVHAGGGCHTGAPGCERRCA